MMWLTSQSPEISFTIIIIRTNFPYLEVDTAIASDHWDVCPHKCLWLHGLGRELGGEFITWQHSCKFQPISWGTSIQLIYTGWTVLWPYIRNPTSWFTDLSNDLYYQPIYHVVTYWARSFLTPWEKWRWGMVQPDRNTCISAIQPENCI